MRCYPTRAHTCRSAARVSLLWRALPKGRDCRPVSDAGVIVEANRLFVELRLSTELADFAGADAAL